MCPFLLSKLRDDMSVSQNICRRLGEPLLAADVRERCAWIGVPSKILQVNDVSPSMPGCRERRHAE